MAEVSQKLASLLPNNLGKKLFGELVEKKEGRLNGRMSTSEPPASDLEEIDLRASAKKALKERNFATAITCAVKLLARIAAQLRTDCSAYELFHPDTHLDADRLSLDTLSKYAEKNTSATLSRDCKILDFSCCQHAHASGDRQSLLTTKISPTRSPMTVAGSGKLEKQNRHFPAPSIASRSDALRCWIPES